MKDLEDSYSEAMPLHGKRVFSFQIYYQVKFDQMTKNDASKPIFLPIDITLNENSAYFIPFGDDMHHE